MAVIVSRRRFVGEALIALGVGSAGSISAQVAADGAAPLTRAQWDVLITRMRGATLVCARTLDLGEGPFYYDSSPARRSLVEGRPGLPLRLGITVAGFANENACLPLAGAVVDIWQADGTGLYSNVGDDLQTTDAVGETFLRGHQVTDQTGYVEFDTVVPGWELVPMPEPIHVFRRTNHIHVKVFHERQVLATQLFMPDSLLDRLYRDVDPYRSHRRMTAPGLGRYYERIRNAKDSGFAESGARALRIERSSAGLYAKATVGIGGSMGTRGLSSRWR